MYWLLKIVQDCLNLIKIARNIAQTNIVKYLENNCFCKTSKNQRIAKMSQVGVFTLYLLFFSPTNISRTQKSYVYKEISYDLRKVARTCSKGNFTSCVG